MEVGGKDFAIDGWGEDNKPAIAYSRFDQV